ncbi:FimV/HubP family polar landmark protein [Nitrosococcus watsonii]|uniref:FimV N-terminal domain protein n=1 Tax=Nitrosococcus watsoni (strain C-113) TaxID=105559 RepID=D8K7H3_NITWC|nr:FimV/HubP family polar landmark protein [Nitrosococcus watsonii]ADJ28850.1 FimV N-terminal domain protein [Nitrosococcus watsonii C-113]
MVRKTIVSVSVAGLLAASSSWEAHSLGVGGITLKSGLNQPFRAEIPLHAVRETALEDINVKLAPSEDFFRAGLDRALVLGNLRFRPLRKGTGETVIEVTSKGPIREPFLGFLVAVTWPQGRLLREYTVLLDPPFLMEPGPAIVSSVASVRDPVVPVTPPKAETWSVRIPEPIAESAMVSSTAKADSSVYGPIRPAETLWPIAQRVRPSSSIAPQQMMLALLWANPDVFLHGNINGLKVGRMLNIPAEEEALKLTFAEAVEQVQQHNKAWAALGSKRQAFEAEGSQEEKAPTNESEGKAKPLAVREDVLPLLSEEKGPGVQESNSEDIHLQALLSLTQEALATRTQENEALQARLQAMESQVNTLQQQLSTKDARPAGLEIPAETKEKETLVGAQDKKFEKLEFLAPSMEEIAALTLSSSGEEAFSSSGEKAAEATPPVLAASPPMAGEEGVLKQEKTAEEFVSVAEVSEPEGVLSALGLRNFLLLGGGSVLLLVLAALRLRKRDESTEESAPRMFEKEVDGDEPARIFAQETVQASELFQENADRMDLSDSPVVFPAEDHERTMEADERAVSGDYHETSAMPEETLSQKDDEIIQEDSDSSADLNPWSSFSDETLAAPFSPAEEEAAPREDASVEENTQVEGAGLEFDLGGMVLAKPNIQDDGITDQSVEAEREERVIEFESFSSPLETEENIKEVENSEESLAFFSPEFEVQEGNHGLLVLETPADGPESTPLEPADPAASVDTLGEDGGEASLPGKALMEDLDEMEVKLDLARAYMDMGDADGARGLLEEVIAEGTEQQRGTGKGLLAELAKAS